MAVVTASQFHKLARTVRARGRVRHVVGEMNVTERKYSEYLDGLKALGTIADYKFESIKLRLADKTYFTADFAVLLPDGYLEIVDVKATRRTKTPDGGCLETYLAEDDAAVKIKVAAEQYPWFQFVLVFRRSSGYWERREY